MASQIADNLVVCSTAFRANNEVNFAFFCSLRGESAGDRWIPHSHDDVIKWKHFPCYWTFVRGIYWWLVDSPHKWPVTRSFDVFFDMRLNTRLSKQSRRRWFETPSRSLWRHCNEGPVMPKPFPYHELVMERKAPFPDASVHVCCQEWYMSLWYLWPTFNERYTFIQFKKRRVLNRFHLNFA